MSRWKWAVLVGLGVMILMVPSSSPVVAKIAQAIAYAEGFFVVNSRPWRNHNPGDLELDVIGKGIGKDGPYVIYGSDADGWEALEHQVSLMFHGSHIYKPSMTIREVANHYTATDQDIWASNVASQLDVSVDTPLNQIT